MAKNSRRGNGEGTITHRADGRWEARITLLDGRRKCFYGRTRQEVATKLTKAQHDQGIGLPIITDERLTVRAWLEQWLETMRPPRLRDSTHRRYRQLLAHVIKAYGELRLTRLAAAQIRLLYARLQQTSQGSAAADNAADNADDADESGGRSSTTVHHLHTVLRKALREAVHEGLIVANPTDRVDAPKLRRPPIVPFTLEETQRLLAAAHGDRLEALYTLAVTTGMRLGELLALTWRHIQLDTGKLQVVASLQRVSGEDGVGNAWRVGEPKTSRSRRQITLSQTAVEALRAHRVRQLTERMAAGAAWQDHDLVFCNEIGERLNGMSVTRYQFRRLLRAADLPSRRFHDLRHTAATLMLLGNVPAKVVSETLGHSTIAITLDIYSHVLPDMQAQAASVMDALLIAEKRAQRSAISGAEEV